MNVDTVPIDDNQKADSFSGPRAFSFSLSLEGEGCTMGAATATPTVNSELVSQVTRLRPIPAPFL